MDGVRGGFLVGGFSIPVVVRAGMRERFAVPIESSRIANGDAAVAEFAAGEYHASVSLRVEFKGGNTTCGTAVRFSRHFGFPWEMH